MMGTQRQADAIVKLMVKAQRLKSAEHERQVREVVLAATQEEVQAQFDKLNAILGFDKKTSPATAAQINLLASLERQVYGTALDFRTRGRLTYQEADQNIKMLKAELAERETLKATEPLPSSLDELI